MPGSKKEFCAPAFTPNFAQIIKMTVKFGVSFELLMNRGLEKNNEGERLAKQETKKSGRSVTHSGFGKGRPQARVWGQSPQPPEAKGVWGLRPQPPTDF